MYANFGFAGDGQKTWAESGLHLENFLGGGGERNCMVATQVAGSNQNDWKTRWQLHSVDPTSTGLSLPGQNINCSPIARVLYGR